LCSFFILPSSPELSQAKRDRRSASSDTRKERKFFPVEQRGVKKARRSLSGKKFDEDTPLYRRPDPGYFKEGEVLLKFKSEVSMLTGERLLLNYGMIIKKSFRHAGVQVIKLPPSMSVGKAIGILMKEPSIEYVEPNFIVRICDVPNDPRFDELWGLHNTGQTGGTPDADIDAPEAWDIHTGNGDVVVGVIDTGVDYTHEDLVDNMWINQAEATGVPGVDDDSNGYIDDIYGINAITGSGDPMDDAGHGTHCSGTIGAVGNNAVGVIGVNWDVEIMGLKFLSSTGSGAISDAIECIEYVLDMHTRGVNIRITSNSWGGGGYSQAAYDAISALRDEDILFCAAAGNDLLDNDASPHYPSSYDLYNIIAVAATDHNDQLASLSYWGSNYGLTSVDVAAPGVDILSTLPGGGYDPAPGDIFFDHVEAGTGNWSPDVPWAITETRSYSPTHSWTDSPGEDYDNYVDASLTSEIIDLSGYTGQNIRVGFYAWVDLETGWDYLYIEVSGDGGTTWISVGSLTGHETYWDLYSYYIPESVRTSQFRFRFRLVTDSIIIYDGVYIDDIGIGIGTGSNNYGSKGGTSMATPHVSGLAALIDSYRGGIDYLDLRDIVFGTIDPLPGLEGLILTGGRINAYSALLLNPADLPPTIYDLSPNKGPVGAEVTINGNRFGDTLGEVTFHEGIQADNIISWSNTSIVVTVPTGASSGPATVTTADGITSADVYFRVGDFLNLHAFIPTGVGRAAIASVDGKIYVVGGYTQGGWVEAGIVQIYHPDLNYWTSGSPKPTPAANADAAVIDGLIYVAGGYQSSTDTILDTLEIYDPANDTWTTGTPLPVALSGPSTAALDGKLYVMGGHNFSGYFSDLYEYEPSSGIWIQLASMNSPRGYFATGIIDGKIYAFGGHDGSDFLSSTEVYDLETYIWTTLASMEVPRYDLAGAALAGRLYAFGGNSQSFWDPPYVQDIEAYYPATNTWEMDSHLLNMARQGLRPADFGSHIFVTGGYVDGISLSINESLGRPFIPWNPVVISYLSASPTSGVIPLEVSFAAQASGGSGSYTYSWSFGDGETSDLQNPTHTYNTEGTFYVTVTVTDADDSDNSTTGRLTIMSLDRPVTLSVGIIASPSSGVAPLTVTFTASISGASPPYTLEWDCGDGTTETQSTDSDTAQVSHTYNTAGTYQVCVVVTSGVAGGSATQTVQASIGISVKPPPSPPDDNAGGGCFIATAAYGSRMEPQVELLREFRDRFLITNSAGKSFVIFYYAYSPPVADFIAKHDTLRAVVRWALLPVVGVSWMALRLSPIVSLALVLLLLGLIDFGAVVTLKRMRLKRQA